MDNNWTNTNNVYWNEIAMHYNNSYTDKWSLLENQFIARRLSFVNKSQNYRILDLGCGTGLGYLLCSFSNPHIEYTGVDISSEMLSVMKGKYPNVKNCHSKMSDLASFSSYSFDGVISIFTAFSYTDNKENTVMEISRVLKEDGAILISVISRFSIRRLLKLEFTKQEKYKTRGIETNGFSNSWTFSTRELRKLFKSEFENIEIIGYNTFGGVLYLTKFPKLWWLNLVISKLFSNFSHELILTATKKSKENV